MIPPRFSLPYPYPLTEDVEVKLTPLSSTKFGSGRPSEQAQALGNFVKTSIVK